MKYIKNSLLLVVFLASYGIGTAQVKFKLHQLSDGQTYQVSIVPENSYRPPLNMTSTAQVTIKVPTNSFEIRNLISIQPNVEWDANSLTTAPEESKEFDYISFGLSSNGTEYLRYETGLEIPVFTFQNALPCTGEVSLMDNATDPFMPPNSARKNVGNQITIAGANGDAYVGNMSKTPLPCGQLSTDVEELTPLEVNYAMYPNPVERELTISLSMLNNSSATIAVYDLIGSQILTKNIDLKVGKNTIPLNVSQLGQGTYLLELRSDDWKLNAGQFIKLGK